MQRSFSNAQICMVRQLFTTHFGAEEFICPQHYMHTTQSCTTNTDSHEDQPETGKGKLKLK